MPSANILEQLLRKPLFILYPWNRQGFPTVETEHFYYSWDVLRNSIVSFTVLGHCFLYQSWEELVLEEGSIQRLSVVGGHELVDPLVNYEAILQH